MSNTQQSSTNMLTKQFKELFSEFIKLILANDANADPEDIMNAFYTATEEIRAIQPEGLRGETVSTKQYSDKEYETLRMLYEQILVETSSTELIHEEKINEIKKQHDDAIADLTRSFEQKLENTIDHGKENQIISRMKELADLKQIVSEKNNEIARLEKEISRMDLEMKTMITHQKQEIASALVDKRKKTKTPIQNKNKGSSAPNSPQIDPHKSDDNIFRPATPVDCE